MNRTGEGKGIVAVALVAGLLALVFWVAAGPSVELTERVPGADRRNAPPPDESAGGPVAGELTRGAGAPSDLPGSWPGFRGPRGDNIDPGSFRPAPADAPFPVCWEIELGEGHAGAAVRKGCVYIHDYDREAERDAIRCLSLADGREIWRYSYPVRIKRNHGMSRTIPAVTEKYLVALGPKCHVTCLDPTSGELLWALDLVGAFGASIPPWYAGQCPIIDGGRAILAPGGTALLVAVDCATGEVLWQSPNERDWKMTHSSIVPMELGGRRFFVYCGSGGVAGVSVDDGRLLWETEEWKIRIANVPTPVVVGDGRIFFSGGYQAGSLMLRLREEGETIVPEVLFRLDHKTFGSAQQTPILLDGHLFGVRPDGQLVCLDLDGKIVWTSSSARKYGLGPYIAAGSLLYVMNDHGTLSRVEATAAAFRLVDERSVLEGHDSWGPMAFAESRLLLRDLTRMICIDVSER